MDSSGIGGLGVVERLGLHGVGFEAGVNTPTYKHYIDFAARNGIEYLVMDDGWSKDKTDLMSGGSDRLDLDEVLRYAKEKGVGIILWAGFRAFDRDMEEVCRHYSALGVKGFKVDFMDRDDQQIAEFLYPRGGDRSQIRAVARLPRYL